MTYHGPQHRGASRAARERRRTRREEAEARNAKTPESRRRAVRLAAQRLGTQPPEGAA